MWNADPEATRKAYRQRADDAWGEYNRSRPEDRPVVFQRVYPWIGLSPDFRPLPESSGPAASIPAPSADGLAGKQALSPVVSGADQLAAMVESFSDQAARKIEQVAVAVTGGDPNAAPGGDCPAGRRDNRLP